MPRLWQDIKPVPRQSLDSIDELVEFVRDEIPAEVWVEEFDGEAPSNLVQRPEKHYHLHLHHYRQLSHHVHNVILWDNEWPVIGWPTIGGMRLLFAVIIVITILLIIPELIMLFNRTWR